MKKIIIAVTLLFSVHLLLAQNVAWKKLGENSTTGKYLDARGFKMYYEVYGTGMPLLFIHGNGGSMRDFSEQVPYFAKDYKLILADSRAQGKSVDERDSLSYEMMADDYSALLTHLKIDSAYVIGWSDEGINALLLALRHPEKVKKMAITGTNLWPDSTALTPWMYNLLLQWNDTLSKAPATPKLKNDLKLLQLMIRQPHIATSDLKKIHCPALVIGGDHDVILPRHTLLIAESISKSYLWILPNSGHSTLQVYSDIFNKTVHDFFRKPYRKIEGHATLR
ncbi:alpha/beta fold hydrolase [Pseudochryseolinea flava]|uniref:Alpha/beta hydrolase n=1 Tax=Pseudochryseolinea flava TaxID=2059302 RepID=A0A364Y5X9_9BACT|nr:alpha/beta hydrolase [Pseudochryseolinea flava]RAW02363.1 alpha/beta hydrolase [Pseudochryseolinea flava]